MGWSKEQGDQFEENVKVNAALSALRKKTGVGVLAGFGTTKIPSLKDLEILDPVTVTYVPFKQVIASAQVKERKQFTVKVCPMGAPRMTRRDKWKSRPVVERYFAYRDVIRAAVGDIPVVPDRVECAFHIPMPPSWSNKKALEMAGKPHRQRPDKDNIEKGLFDSLFLEDGGVWSGEQHKYWCKPGEERIEITMIWL
jgi:Holliday junction resolvase RusA-like endonuclease